MQGARAGLNTPRRQNSSLVSGAPESALIEPTCQVPAVASELQRNRAIDNIITELHNVANVLREQERAQREAAPAAGQETAGASLASAGGKPAPSPPASTVDTPTQALDQSLLSPGRCARAWRLPYPLLSARSTCGRQSCPSCIHPTARAHHARFAFAAPFPDRGVWSAALARVG